MSITKRIWIENDPAYEDVRQARREEMGAHLGPYTERMGWRRFSTIDGEKRLDPTWRMAVYKALDELKPDYVNINESLMFRTEEDRDEVRALAESLHPELNKKYGLKPPKRCPNCQNKMAIKLARRGSKEGKYFWGCSGYPECRFTQDCEVSPIREAQYSHI
ncbi:topoisomerase DNA-binding C4 zinc finger domain-containing protein [Hyphomonas sp.]|uniref:topoisomerase DNA-binding C4 zinc finger domain-containing protein n=1 Tax=Hyphomonas sp. TaxID=87 RepID=UPI003F72D975